MDLKISEIENILKEQLSNEFICPDIEECGKVIIVKDGVTIIHGLNKASFSELVVFDNKYYGIVQKISEHYVEVTLLCEDTNIKEGMLVKRTKKGLRVPTGKGVLGRILNALGEPIDHEGDIKNAEYKDIEKKAPGVMDRQSVYEPLHTGIKAIDSLIPIGKGQRELIIGDRQTGKTSIAIDTILNQKETNAKLTEKEKVYCIYVAIGQKCSTVAKTIEILKNNNVMDYTTIVMSQASDTATLQYLTPYTACTIGEYFRDNGMHCLIVYDDLSKHAVAYRQMSLLLRRPPGREAYPGDIFYLHSRLLERAAKMSQEKGGGSLTALPIVETQAGDISAYIPTNVISITDGQIFLETELFNKGIRPALNIGSSVSRVGSTAQTKAMKQVSGSLKIELAQFREKESFLQFSSDLDDITKKLLNRGQILTELLKQNVNSPMHIVNQIISILIGTNGIVDDIDISKIQNFEDQAILYIKEKAPEIVRYIEENGNIKDKSHILKHLNDFKNIYIVK